MTPTTSKIKEIKSVKEHNGNYGTIFYHDLVMENGDTGSLGKKKEGSLNVWDEITYTKKENKRGGFNFREVVPQRFGGSPSDPKADFIRTAMECAVQLASTEIITEDDIERYFDSFYSLMSQKNADAK